MRQCDHISHVASSGGKALRNMFLTPKAEIQLKGGHDTIQISS